MNSKVSEFLKKKDINISAKTYFVDAMSGMAQGLFASLLIGTIIKTLGQQLLRLSVNPVFKFPGQPYAAGPLGVFIAVIIAVEFGKAISKETKVDILVTPIVTLGIGYLIAYLTCPAIAVAMNWLGEFINYATTMHPFLMGIVISVVVGIILTLPISSAAICASIGIAGIAGGAALAGCCAQMVGFAVASFRENKWGGIVSQGLGTSMLQMPNIVRHPAIWIPPTLAAAITGPLATVVFQLECSKVSAGMGTCGLVGPIGCFSDMSASGTLDAKAWIGMLVVCIIAPAVLSLVFSEIMRKIGWIKADDMKL